MENTSLRRNSLKKAVYGSWFAAFVLILAAASAGYALEQANSGNVIAVANAVPAMDIFLNNISMLGLNILGAFLLGIPNLISGVMNGYAFGSFACIAGQQLGTEWMLRSILPHGWLEIPVILVAVSFGALPWIYIARRMKFPQSSRRTLLRQLGKYLCIAALVCTAALMLAAIIEANISMKLA